MKVICKKGSTKLVKGLVYDADWFDNTKNLTSHWQRQTIRIRGFGTFLCKNFTDTSGNPLPEIVYNNPQAPQAEPRFNISELKKNDIIVCKSDRYKYLVKGGKYRISEIKDVNTWSANIKLEGYNRWIRFSTWAFRKLSIQESRDLALSQIFNQPENFSVEFVRKFDKESNKTKVLLQALAKSILDPYRHEYDVVNWTIEKTKYQDLRIEDFQEMLNKPLSEVLSDFENSLNYNVK